MLICQLKQIFFTTGKNKFEMSKHLLQLVDEYWKVSHESSLCPFPFGLCSPTNPGWPNQMDHISEIYSNCDLCLPVITEKFT